MTKAITFLRHYKLAYPFDNWRNMNLSQYTLLTEGKINPKIDTDIYNFLSKNFTKDQFKDYEIVLTSDFIRTNETAEAIIQHFSLGLDIESNPLLNEIPSKITSKLSEEYFLQMKHNQRLSINKRRILDRKKKIKRLTDIDTFVRAQPQNNILIISHSYLIGQLNYFYNILQKNLDSYIESDADKYEVGGYIKGFSIKTDY